MPQIFQVLKCYKCAIFQVHLRKKSPKWECKMCGEKQSIKRHYGIGTAQECRGHVQKLNAMQGDKNASSIIDIDNEDDNYTQSYKEELKENYAQNRNKRASKWSAFIENDEDIQGVRTETEYYEGAEVVLAKNQKRKMSHKEMSNADDITKIYVNKKTCYQKSEHIKQCNENASKQSKWLAYTLENENVPVINESTSCNKVSSDISNKKYSTNNKEELEIDCNQFDKKTVKNSNIKYLADNENTANVLCYARNLYKNSAKIGVPIILENNNLDTITVQGSKWSQLLETNYSRNFKPDEDKSPGQNGNKLLFSLCDDKDLDSILDF